MFVVFLYRDGDNRLVCVYTYLCMYILLVWRWFVAGRQREKMDAGARLGKNDNIAYLEREMFDLVCREVGR